MKQLPSVRTDVDQVWLDGGLDLISPPGYAKPGTCRFATNYELDFGGGYRRVGGFERYSGQPSPHLAVYFVLEASAGFTVALGDTVTGSTSAATGKVVWISADAKQIGLTKVVGGPGPFELEQLTVSAVPVGTVTDNEPPLDGFAENEIAHAAADEYRADIARPAGSGAILGVAVLNDVVYCWRGDAGALVTYKETATGWEVVPLYFQVSFTAGTSEYADGSTISQGGGTITATVKRAVLESGTWGVDAAGRLIIDPVAGTLAAGAAAGGGACTLSGAPTQITQTSGGRVDSVVHNFTGSTDTKRLYCCDGVNPEWEFDGTTIVPLNTGMGAVRATSVAVLKNHLFYAYRGSLQYSGVGEPYKWSPVFGAGEIGTGDVITNQRPVSGTEVASALMVLCANSAFVLYGYDDDSWQLVKVSDEAGAQAFSAQEVGGILAFDRNDFRRFVPTDTFGNFGYESESRMIEPLVRNATVLCSVLAKSKSQYRCFFSDGLFVTATPMKKGWGWMACDYGRTITCAVGAEISGAYRIFLGDADGWVLEADVGRSFDGDDVLAYMRMSSQNQKNPIALKQYRNVEIVSVAESAFEYAVAAEFSDDDAESAAVTQEAINTFKKQYGAGLFYDFNSWDRAYYDANQTNRIRFDVQGNGRSITLLVSSEAANALPHTLKTTAILYTPRRLGR